jgi:hypothetical protein
VDHTFQDQYKTVIAEVLTAEQTVTVIVLAHVIVIVSVETDK